MNFGHLGVVIVVGMIVVGFVALTGCDAVDKATNTTFEERCAKYRTGLAVAKALPPSADRDKRIAYYDALIIACPPAE